MLNQGIYEEVISKKLKMNLADLDVEQYDIGKEPINTEEARKSFSSYIATVTR